MSNKVPLTKEFLQYIAKPKTQVSKKPSFKRMFFNVARLWSVIFLVSMFFAMLANFFLAQEGYSEDDFAITKITQEFPYLLVFFIIVFWAPLSEELAFRLWLRFSPVNWALGLGFLSMFLVTFPVFSFIPENFFSLDSAEGFARMVLFTFSISLIVYLLLRIQAIKDFLGHFFEKRFKFFFYSLAIIFAVLHITNYDVDLREVWYFAPILIFPQLFLSFTISFIRMRYGFSWAVFTHALNNFVAITPLLLIMNLDPNLLRGENVEQVLDHLSLSDMLFLFLTSSFLILVFAFCFFSLISLTLEFTRRR